MNKIWLFIIASVLSLHINAFSQTTISGIVIDRETNKPIVGTTIAIKEIRKIIITNDAGRFEIPYEAGKTYTILFRVMGYKQKKIVVDSPTKARFLKVYLNQKLISGSEVVVRAKKEKPKVSRRTIKREELKRIPGTSGDLMRSIQSLPGVITSNDLSGQLYVRGNGPYDNKILIDKFWLVNAYHYGGFVSVINTDIIESIDFYTGGFPVIYGEATGSILEITTREKEEPTWGGKVNVNLLTADMVLETPFTDNGYMLLSGRRSHFDLYGEKIMENAVDEADVTVLPYFWDYQAKIGYYFTKKNKIAIASYGSYDTVGLTIKEGEDVNFENRKLSYSVTSHGQGITWKYVPSKKFFSSLMAAAYQQKQRMFFGEYISLDSFVQAYNLREDMTLNLSKYISYDFGIQYIYGIINMDGKLPVRKLGAPDNPDFPDDFEFIPIEFDELDYHHYDGYLQQTLTIGIFKWALGVRYDVHQEHATFDYWSPRTSLEIELNKSNRIYGACGLYQQAHFGYFTNDDFGNPDLTTQKAIHYVGGYQIDVTKKTSLTLEGYYKKLWDLVVTGGDTIFFDDIGTGRVYGGELLLRRELEDGLFGWFSYSYTKAMRDDKDERGEYFFEFDRTHIVNLIASYKISKKIQVGLKWRYATGMPYTEIVGSDPKYNIPGDDSSGIKEYRPKYSGNYNKDRMPAYQKLDLRIDFFTKWFGLDWDVYIEILNTYNSKNIYEREFDQRKPYEEGENPKDIRDLPFLPYFGVEVRF